MHRLLCIETSICCAVLCVFVMFCFCLVSVCSTAEHCAHHHVLNCVAFNCAVWPPRPLLVSGGTKTSCSRTRREGRPRHPAASSMTQFVVTSIGNSWSDTSGDSCCICMKLWQLAGVDFNGSVRIMLLLQLCNNNECISIWLCVCLINNV